MATDVTRSRHPAGRAVSIVDVAQRAGVSISTVSRTLRRAGNVSHDTRERVLRAAAELSYVPSPAASRLASGRTGTVGVIVAFFARWFFSEVIRGAEHELRQAGFDLLLYNVCDPSSRRHLFDSMPLRRRVDAVLAVATGFDEVERAALTALGVPVVTVGCQPWPGSARVGIDDRESAGMAVRHLALLGHRDVVMISGRPEDPIGRTTTLARQAGFLTGLADAGMVGAGPVGAGSVGGGDRIIAEPWGVRGGRRAMERLLTRRVLPTAVFAESDEMAFGVLQTLRRVGLDVPGDISVIGFDDHELAEAVDLTTIAQPVHDQGRLAARAVLELVGGEPSGDIGLVLPTRLVVRGTTAPPRSGTAIPGGNPATSGA